MKAVNVSKSTTVASSLAEATGFFSRLMGLIGKDLLEDGAGLWMARCRAIHTFGMRFPIDVIFVDRHMTVKKMVEGVPPFRPIVLCVSAKGVIELPAGAIEKAQVQPGDKIEIVHTSK